MVSLRELLETRETRNEMRLKDRTAQRPNATNVIPKSASIANQTRRLIKPASEIIKIIATVRGAGSSQPATLRRIFQPLQRPFCLSR